MDRVIHVEPPFVEYWKVTLPVGAATPPTPVKVTDAVTDCPSVIGLGGLKVGVVIVGFALFTVRDTGAVCEPKTFASPLYMALNL